MKEDGSNVGPAKDGIAKPLAEVIAQIGWRDDPRNMPRDGTTVEIKIEGCVRAYWDDDLAAWLLCTPLHIDSIRNPKAWRACHA